MNKAMKPKILILNAALAGSDGNTAVLLARAEAALCKSARVETVVLRNTPELDDVSAAVARADGVLIGTGTHWDSWSSHLQAFLEHATPSEGTRAWLGKPAAVIVTMHSVGGKGVLSRLQGVLNTLGCSLPPMSGMVYSLVNQELIANSAAGSDDVWCPDDVDVICHNLLAALNSKSSYKSWPVDRTDYSKKWIRD